MINSAHVSQVTKDLVADGGVPLELGAVTQEAGRWYIVLRKVPSGGIVYVAVPDTVPATQLREALRQQLDEAGI